MRAYGHTRFDGYDTDGHIKAGRARENLVAEDEIDAGEYEHVAYRYEDDSNTCWPDCPFCYESYTEVGTWPYTQRRRVL